MPSHWHYCSISLLFTLCAAGTLNRTIDDTLGDEITGLKPTYSPDGVWNLGPACAKCTISKFVDTTQARRGSWHDATYGPAEESDINITASFNGTAVYVFNLIPNYSTSTATHLTSLSFYVDGNYGGQYNHTPQYTSDSTPNILYQVPVYANSNLTSAEHTIRISASGSLPSVVLFDYILYTTEDDSPPSTTSSQPTPSLSVSDDHKKPAPAGLIAGAVAGGVAALTILLCGALACTRRRVRRSRSQQSIARAPSPFLLPSTWRSPWSRPGMSHGRTPSASPLTARLPYTRASSEMFALHPVHASHIPHPASDIYPDSNASAVIDDSRSEVLPAISISPNSAPRSGYQHGSGHSREKLSGPHTPSLPPSTSMSPSETDTSRVNPDERVQPTGLRPSEAVEDAAGNRTTAHSQVEVLLHTQLAELREEVERLRDQYDAPPRYE